MDTRATNTEFVLREATAQSVTKRGEPESDKAREFKESTK
jgi:hypothetical protein